MKCPTGCFTAHSVVHYEMRLSLDLQKATHSFSIRRNWRGKSLFSLISGVGGGAWGLSVGHGQGLLGCVHNGSGGVWGWWLGPVW